MCVAEQLLLSPGRSLSCQSHRLTQPTNQRVQTYCELSSTSFLPAFSLLRRRGGAEGSKHGGAATPRGQVMRYTVTAPCKRKGGTEKRREEINEGGLVSFLIETLFKVKHPFVENCKHII